MLQINEALTGFVQFHDQVYNYRDARWPAPLELHFSILTGDTSCAPIAWCTGEISEIVFVAIADPRSRR